MAWIESHQTLREHPKLYAFMAAANVSRSAAVGHLHLLWWWAIDYAMDGTIRADENAIARAADWPGDPTTFVSALVQSGFLDRDETGIKLHDWSDYCGQLIEKRLKRLADKRRKVAAVRRPKVPVRTPTVPNPTVPNPTLPYPTEPNHLSGRAKRADTDPRVKEFVDFYFRRFVSLTGTAYHVNGGKDGKTVKRLLASFDLPELERRADAFLASRDPFVLKAGHTLGVFASMVNRFAPPPKGETSPLKELADAVMAKVREREGEPKHD